MNEARNRAIRDLIANHLEEYEKSIDRYNLEIRIYGGILE